MFKQRVLTALLLAPLALLAVFYLPLSGFALFVSVAFLLGAWEWSGFCGLANRTMRAVYTGLTAAILLAIYYIQPIALQSLFADTYTLTLVMAGVIWWLLAVVLVLTFPRSQGLWAGRDWLKALMGWLTLLPAWSAIVFVRGLEYPQAEFTGAWLLFGLLGLVWAADIGGYIVGKPFGKTKLLPKVSPGKTLEGMLGGMGMVLLLVSAVGYWQDWPDQILYWYLAAVILTALSVFGDLTESMFKRAAGKKDSGAFLPGHGGILDRIDSLTATAPLYALLLALFGGFN
ncbi:MULTISPECIES: phosphatidate cytidylyltransferase [unclassified Arsukibacterium]|uniref:phosphatidate cytidylyltransferase n=1 Tax=unclassified Arsukibacterium TaxID=2635278 RepID=UPI000C975FCE|nr:MULTISPECIES: phosphatidate cytidylyltransferase [unclassified Arsukibacterium]MAA95676.1 phosphatidate cytidylyltransferase [Rheinheimera sp.]HAW92669.1 phosphatidate cytidylyltransferase [Candidatus Azambacteria bacterium]